MDAADDRGERLVDLEQVDVGRPSARSVSRARWMARDGWVSSDGSGPATMPKPTSSASGGEAQLLGLGPADHDHGGRAVGDLRRVAGGDGAVGREGRLAAGRARRPWCRGGSPSSVSTTIVALALADRDRDDLVGQPALLGGDGTPARGSWPPARPGAPREMPAWPWRRPRCRRPCGRRRRRTTGRRGSWSRRRSRRPAGSRPGPRAAGRGAWLIDSMPPATTTSASPDWIIWSARWMAWMPDRHTLLTVTAGTSMGTPPLAAAWRAGFWPWPAWSTWPMTTWSTWSGLDAGPVEGGGDGEPAELGGRQRRRARRDSLPMGVRADETRT